MTADPPETTFAVLGLIDKVPASSGHELASVADRSFAHFWPISRTLLYRELSRLVERGWVRATRVEQTRIPSKWIYHITEDGQQALGRWLGKSVPLIGRYRSSVLLRFFFAHRMDSSQLHLLLADYRSALQTQRDEFAATIEMLESSSAPAARMGRLNALHGLRTADARLVWVEEASAELDAKPARRREP